MKLYIDTADNRKIVVGLDDERWEFKTEEPQSQKVLSLISKTLKDKRISLRQVEEIQINQGPGSFTGLRVGLSVANALGWALGKPVNGSEKIVLPKYEK